MRSKLWEKIPRGDDPVGDSMDVSNEVLGLTPGSWDALATRVQSKEGLLFIFRVTDESEMQGEVNAMKDRIRSNGLHYAMEWVGGPPPGPYNLLRPKPSGPLIKKCLTIRIAKIDTSNTTCRK